MERGGWTFTNIDEQLGSDWSKFEDNCESNAGAPNTWWGFGNHLSRGSVLAPLKGNGSFNLKYGNCYTNNDPKNKVVVTLQGSTISSIGNNIHPRQTGEVKFNNGDTLEIEEYYGIIKIHSITFNCEGK